MIVCSTLITHNHLVLGGTMDAAVIGSARMLYNQIYLYDPLADKIKDNKALSNRHTEFLNLCNTLVRDIVEYYRASLETINKALSVYEEIKELLKDSYLIIPFTTWNITWVLNTLKTAHFMDDEAYSYKYNIPYDMDARRDDMDFKLEHSSSGAIDSCVY